VKTMDKTHWEIEGHDIHPDRVFRLGYGWHFRGYLPGILLKMHYNEKYIRLNCTGQENQFVMDNCHIHRGEDYE
jgi:hypothetical protein